MSLRQLSIVLSVAAVLIFTGITKASTFHLLSDTTWKATSPFPGSGWNTNVNFNDSSWVPATAASAGSSHIWYLSTKSASSPADAWFREIFTLTSPVTSAAGTIILDDDGEVYINGTQIINDTGGGATHFNLDIDPSLFVVGQNFIAIHGINKIAPDNSTSVDVNINSAPEPASLSLLAFGSLLLLRRRRTAGSVC